jgi:hypothetical protein
MRILETSTAAVAASCSRKAPHVHEWSIWMYCDLKALWSRLGRAKQSSRPKRETISIRDGELFGWPTGAVASRGR